VIGEIRERISALDRREWVGLVLIGALIVGGAFFWYARSLPTQVRIDGSAAPLGATGGAAMASSSPSPTPAIVVVYVTGWVRHPGVFEFTQGERVIDAIKRAGGPRMGADLTAINLAALLTDAMQIVVGKRGQLGGAGAPSGGSIGAGGTGGIGGTGDALVNINTATLDQLDSLLGIGPALAQRIITYRDQHGPFRSIQDLLNVSGIGDKKFAELRSRVTV
jgi:competence protein ComEA